MLTPPADFTSTDRLRRSCPAPMMESILFFLNRNPDAAGELFDDLVLAAEHRRQIEGDVVDLDAVMGELVLAS